MQNRLSITSNIKWLGIANLVVKPFWFVFLLASTRILGAEQFGLYMYAVSFVAVIAILADGGIDIHLVRRLSADVERYPRFFIHSLLLKVVSGILVGGGTLIVALFISTSSEVYCLLLIAVLYSTFNTVMIHARSVFRAYEIMQYEALSIIVEKVCVIIICLVCLVVFNSAKSFITGFAISYIFACSFTIVLVFSKIGTPSGAFDFTFLWKEVVKPALPFALMNIFTVIYFRSGTLMISALTGKEEFVGYFNAGYRLVESYMLIPLIVSGPLYPVLVRKSQSGEDIGHILLQAVRLVLLISILIVLPIYLYRTDFTHLFFGAGYIAASDVVGIVSLSMIPVGMNFIFGTLVAASGRQRIGNYFIAGITFVNIIVNYMLIPVYGIAGAAITTVLTEGLLVISNAWIVRDHVPWDKLSRLFLKIMISILIVIVCLHFIAGSIIFPFNMMTIVLVLIMSFFMLNIVSQSDWKKLVKAL